MKTYTEEEVARIVELRHVRYQLFANQNKPNCRRIKAVNGDLWQLTQNQAYL